MTRITHPRARYVIRLDNGDVIDVLPTPMLLDQFGRIPIVEGYEDQPASDEYPAIWRMRDDRYDAGRQPEYHVIRDIARKDSDEIAPYWLRDNL